MHRSPLLVLTCVVVLAGLGIAAAAAPPRPSESLMPNTTAGFLSIPNVETLIDQFNKTQIGELVNDPVMEPFAEDIRRQFKEQLAKYEDRLALTIDDLRSVPGGEVAIALVRPAPADCSVVLVADVTGRLDATKALLDRVSKNLVQRGAKQQQQAADGASLLIFDLPPPEDAPKKKDPKAAPEVRQVVYCQIENLLIVGDRLAVVEGVLQRLAAPRGESLADVAGFKQVMARCATDSGKEPPQLRWYVQPLAFADAVRTLTPENRRRKGTSVVDLLQKQGFTALQAAGGYVGFAAEGLELVHRTAVYAPGPWEKSMKMIGFENAKDFGPQAWVPREIATYNTLYFNILNAFDNVGPLYDELFGRGEEGIWDEVLKGLEFGKNGPKINLRNELVMYLGPRVTAITDYQVPITATSERLLFAIETNNQAAVAKAVEKLVKPDRAIKPRKIEGFEEYAIWEAVELENKGGVSAPVVEIPSTDDMPGEKKKEGEEEEEEQKDKLLPHAAFTVAHGHLFYASHLDFLLKVLKCAKNPDPLDRDANFRLVEDTVGRFGFPQRCARTFSFTDEELRPTYELIRQNKLPEAETMIARAINALSTEAKRGQSRKSKVDGAKLPDYDVVRRCLGPAGIAAAVEKDGWFIKGCLLKKQ